MKRKVKEAWNVPCKRAAHYRRHRAVETRRTGWFVLFAAGVVVMLIGAGNIRPANAQQTIASAAPHPSTSTMPASARETSLSKLTQTISVNFEDMTVEKALQHLAERAGLGLYYARDEKMAKEKISLHLKDVTTLDAFYEVIRDQDLSMFITPSGHLIVGVKTMPEEASKKRRPMQGSISGSIVDAASGESLPGVNVVIVGTTQGASSDLNGRYEITGVQPGVYSLQASFIGYETQIRENVEVREGEATEVNFRLQTASVELGEVVAIGYGTQQREDLTGSVGVVDADNIEGLPVASADEALAGQIAGVQVTSTTGLPGSGPKIQIRGHGNVGAGGQPLYVVDGFALPQPLDQEAARFRNPLADIAPSDIESITVLKDASASAIYGSRASNGVVVITTKRGQAGSSQLNLSASSGFQRDISWMAPDLASAREYVEFENYIWQNRVENGAAEAVPEMFRNPEQYSASDGTDWLDVIRRENAPMFDLQGSISGGGESIRSYFSAGLRRQEGIIWNTSFTRLNLRANLDADISERVQIGLNLAPSYTLRSHPLQQEARGGAIANAMRTCPLDPWKDEQGELIPFPSETYNNGTGCPGALKMPNARYGLEVVDNDFTGVRALGSTYLKVKVADAVSARTSLNVDWGTSERTYFNPSTFGSRNTPPPVIPAGELQNNRDLSWLSETTLNWAEALGPGNIDAVAGFTAQTGTSFGTLFTGDFPNDDIRTLNVASRLTGTSVEEDWSLLSVLGRVNYSLLGRYIFTATVRSDGSSRFGAGNRWGVFPSGAIAWNLHKEPFMQPFARSLPRLRLRSSFGVTGNNQIGNYAALGVVSRDDYLFGETVAGGSRLTSLSNADLGWERTEEWNVGVDAALFNYRLQFTADAYSRTTTDLLLPRLLPFTSGFGAVTENLGEIRNRGIELGLTGHIITGERVSWTTNFNWSLNRNKVLSLPGGVPIFSGGAEGFPTHITKEGHPVGLMIGYDIEGIYQSEEDIQQYPSFEGAIPGNLRWKDANGDGKLTPGPLERGGDFIVIGDPHPDFVVGLTNSVTYGPLNVRVLITGRVGGDVARIAHFRENRNLDGQLTVASDYVQNFWRSPQNPGDGETPTPVGSGEARRRYRGMHSAVIEDGSNIWVRNVMIRYTLPEKIAGGPGSSLYFSVQNPLIVTSYPGNPEVESNDRAGGLELGMDNLSYPIARQFTIGIDLSL